MHLEETLQKKAIGYTVDEIVEEYALTEGDMLLVKRKVTSKHIPPDLAALKLILDQQSETLNHEQQQMKQMTGRQLLQERRRIKNNLERASRIQEMQNENKQNNTKNGM